MRRTTVVLAVAALAVAALCALPAAAAAEGDVTVEQANDGTATVTVTDNGSAVADAAVTVEVTDENGSYAGAGDYATDANGTVDLPVPSEDVNVSITATYDGTSTAVAGTLYAVDGDDGENATDGEDATDGGEEGDAFGQLVSAFVHEAQNDTDGGIGPLVANFVLENNPAADSIPDHAGPPERAGPPTDGERGPPAHVRGDDNATEGGAFTPVDVGPPEHAGPPSDRDRDDDDDRGNGERGPPEHAGPPGDE